MKKNSLALAILGLFVLPLTSCSKDDGNIEVKIVSSAISTIPGTATSCLTKKTTPVNILPSKDITSDYATVPTITFSRKDTSKTLVITQVRFEIDIPGATEKYTRTFGGDGLAALSSSWFSASGTNEAAIAPGVATFVTDCAVKLGGISMERGMSAAGTVEVFGFERDANNEESPIRTSTIILIQSL